MIEILLSAIPLEAFDQQKLETLVRRIPEALVRTEKIEHGEKRFYSYPKNSSGFKINCESTHYLHSKFPSDLNCSLNITQEIDPKLDEHQITFTDSELYKTLSYDADVKKFYSNERVYGLKMNGKYGEMFRYGFICDVKNCQLTFSTRPADNY
jgi:hypothetical protein